MNAITQPITPAVGQVWADNDPRGYGRELVIRRIFDFNGEKYAYCHTGSRSVRIKLARFRPTANGYRFVRENL